MQLQIKEKGALYAAYISAFANGGIFVPTNKPHKLGDEMYVLVTLPGDTMRYPIAGKVASVLAGKTVSASLLPQNLCTDESCAL